MTAPPELYHVWQVVGPMPTVPPVLIATYGDRPLAYKRAAREASAGKSVRIQWALLGEAPAGPMMMPQVDG